MNPARGEAALEGKSGRTYPVAFTLEALMEFERRTRTPAMDVIGRVMSGMGEIGEDADTGAAAVAMARLGISVTETYELLRAGLYGARRRKNPKVTTIADREVGAAFSDCGGTVAVFVELLDAFVSAEDLLGDLAEDEEDEEDEDEEGGPADDAADPPEGPGGSTPY